MQPRGACEKQKSSLAGAALLPKTLRLLAGLSPRLFLAATGGCGCGPIAIAGRGGRPVASSGGRGFSGPAFDALNSRAAGGAGALDGGAPVLEHRVLRVLDLHH